jgi:aconitase B
MRFDLFPHPFGERDARVEHGARQQEHELLAAVSAGPVDLPHLGAQDARELLEHCVAGLVAVRVVHTLESIEIDHHAGERLVQPLGVLEHLVDPLLEMPPIIEPREDVGL